MKFKSHIGKMLTIMACAIMFSLGGVSCSAPKNIAYFQDIDNVVMDANNAVGAMKIRPEDKLTILVSSKNPEMSAIFNLSTIATNSQLTTTATRVESGAARTSTSVTQQSSYYTVSPDGTIDFPVLGIIKVEGMTRSELSGYIKGEIVGRGYLKDPVVTVEFINSGISVLGEVNSPGRYILNRDHITVLDALALAGDLTIQGQRENVLVVREDNGKRYTYRLDLTKGQQFLNSPGYYLKQDDIVYVEPNAVKKRQTTVNGNNVLSAPFWVSVASLLTSVAVLIFK